ncbi:mttA/Hcf106 family [Fragilaria crotonensis]|nr:mttA/Hcf106 family [Fragilaria crotonensis]
MQRLITLFTLLVAAASAFAPPTTCASTTTQVNGFRSDDGSLWAGCPELVVIAIAAAFLLGPQKLAELGKDAGKIAGELKEVPKEFQAGMAEGEKQARAIKKEITGEPAEDATKE